MSGRHFLQIPGPSNVPERVRLAMDRAVCDHRGPDLPAVTREIVDGLRLVFGSPEGQVILFPGSGTAAAEASIANTVNPGEEVLAFNNGQFSHNFADCARHLGAEVNEVECEWGEAVQPDLVEKLLRADAERRYAAVLVVHNETSTGATTDLAAIGEAIRAAGHPALFIVDSVSGAGSLEFKLDEWGVDVALTGAQKGLMLPPGMGMICAGERAMERSRTVTTPRYFLDWGPVVEQMRSGYFPYTPATLHLFGLREALRMLQEEGLTNVFARHRRLAESVRQAIEAQDLEILCRNPAERSNTVTAVRIPAGVDADRLHAFAEELNLALGAGLGRLKGQVFRIGHLGSLNELEVLATLGGVEMVLSRLGARVRLGAGLAAAEAYLAPRPARAG